MSVLHFLDKSVVIRRLQTVSGSLKNYVATATIDMHIQDITEEESQQFYGAYNATHKAWIDIDQGIQDGDKVIDADGVEYEVVNINKKTYAFAINKHVELILKLNETQ